MPIKGQSPKQVVHTEMHKFKHGTLHSGSKQGPKVKSREQAIAIALSEARQAKGKGKPKGYDRSGHHPGNPGFRREGAPPYGEYHGGAHAKQPKGRSLGAAPEMTRHKPGQTFAEEQREHMGIPRKGQGMGHKGKMGNIDNPKAKGSHLLEENPMGHDKQPKGRGLGYHNSAHRAEHHQGCFGGAAHSFGHAAHQRNGYLRSSGHSGAHRIGKR